MCSMNEEQHLGLLELDVAPVRDLVSTISRLHSRHLQSKKILEVEACRIISHISSISLTRSFRGPPRAKNAHSKHVHFRQEPFVSGLSRSTALTVLYSPLVTMHLGRDHWVVFVVAIELDAGLWVARFKPERPDTGEILNGSAPYESCRMGIWSNFERIGSGIALCADREIAALVKERQ